MDVSCRDEKYLAGSKGEGLGFDLPAFILVRGVLKNKKRQSRSWPAFLMK
jgi:hypothetical protein